MLIDSKRVKEAAAAGHRYRWSYGYFIENRRLTAPHLKLRIREWSLVDSSWAAQKQKSPAEAAGHFDLYFDYSGRRENHPPIIYGLLGFQCMNCCTISMTESTLTIPAVSQAAMLNQRGFTYSPIRSLRLISSSISTITMGSRMPLSACDSIDHFTSGKFGIMTTAAPPAIRIV